MKRPKLNTNSFKKKRFWRWQFIENNGGCKVWSKGIWENYCHRVCTFQFLSYKWWASTMFTINRKSHKDIPSQIQTVSSILYSCCMDFDWIIRSINITLLVISQGNLSYVTADNVCTTKFQKLLHRDIFPCGQYTWKVAFGIPSPTGKQLFCTVPDPLAYLLKGACFCVREGLLKAKWHEPKLPTAILWNLLENHVGKLLTASSMWKKKGIKDNFNAKLYESFTAWFKIWTFDVK